jgi:3-phenylpropionate/trans-cinnamate dioxygenase ferredoxin subunit
MEHKKLQWVKVAESLEDLSFQANDIAEVTAGNKVVCIARYKNELFAFAHKCPHASGQLSNGYLDALGNIVCPFHRYKFCVKNGRNVSGEGYYLKHWPVKVDAGVYIGFDDSVFQFL